MTRFSGLVLTLTLFHALEASRLCAAPADDVRTALGVLNRVVAHTQRLIDAKNLARLPHEDGEFREGVEALQHAVTHEPVALRQRVKPLIEQARSRSHALAEASGGGDAAALAAAHGALAESVRALIEAFPADERPAAAAPATP